MHFFPFHTLRFVCLTPNNHKLPDSGEAQMLIVFLVESFKVFPYSISGVIDIFLYDIGVYSCTVYAFVVFVVTSCHVILMLLTDCDVFNIELVLLYGLYKVCNTFHTNFKESCWVIMQFVSTQQNCPT